MKYIRSFLIMLAFAIATKDAFSQIPNGQWRDHLAYSKANGIAAFEHKVFCSSPGGIFYYDKRDQSIIKISKVNGLNDIDITAIGADPESNHLIIAYKNGGIDIFDDKTFFFLTDIKRKNILGDKQINSIVIHDDVAYLATGFGVVVLNYLKKEIKDTYIFGPGGTNITVNDIEIIDDFLYAATNKGVYKADLNNPTLVNYTLWEKLEGLPQPDGNYSHIEISQDQVHWFAALRNSDTNKDDVYYLENGSWNLWSYDLDERYHQFTIYNDKLYFSYYSSITVHDLNTHTESRYWGGLVRNFQLIDNEIWAADNVLGLTHYSSLYGRLDYTPVGPISNEVQDVHISNQQILTTRGSDAPDIFFPGEVFQFKNEKWTSYTIDEAQNAVNIISNPKDPNNFYVGTWGHGIFEFQNNEMVDSFTIYNSEVHSLQSIFPGQEYIRIGGMAFDNDENLWATNMGVEKAISVRKPDGQWKGYSYQNVVGDDRNVRDIIITQRNHKWIRLTEGNGGLVVFDENGTIDEESDDRILQLDIIDREEGKLFNDVYSMAEDLDGDIWIGTNQGPLIFYNPESVFDENIRADRIVLPIEIDGQGSYLLENSTITTIAVDGANRKWLGTAHSGIFLLSENGKKEIKHFTEDNSPLFSNQIINLAINHDNGEVFIATPHGLISYMGDATGAGEYFEDVYVYPNPIREDYSGDITITGLARDVNVKITDISGNIVYETEALGGQAIWNGENFSGQRVQTGVYLVFCTSDDGSQTHITKLLFIH